MIVTTPKRCCPRCSGTILWLDGLPSPSLTIVADHGVPRVVGCENCMGRQPVQSPPVQSVPPPMRQNTIVGSPPASTADPRPFREKVAEEGAHMVSLLSHGLDFIEAGAKLWDRLKPRKP